jgi:hypothetical protein
MRLLALALLTTVCLSGCQSGEDIPLVEFPKGAPAPPPESKDAKPVSGDATSKADPTTSPR